MDWVGAKYSGYRIYRLVDSRDDRRQTRAGNTQQQVVVALVWGPVWPLFVWRISEQRNMQVAPLL